MTEKIDYGKDNLASRHTDAMMVSRMSMSRI